MNLTSNRVTTKIWKMRRWKIKTQATNLHRNTMNVTLMMEILSSLGASTIFYRAYFPWYISVTMIQI